jgi:alkylated DNA repair dioxygenase AlkB
MQLSLGFDTLPAGLVYLPDFISVAEEALLMATLPTVELHAVVMHGTSAKRTVAHFGITYAYDRSGAGDAPPLPSWVQPFVPRVARAMHEPETALAELLVTRYPAGAQIGWHRDAPMFGPTVAGLSLAAACTLRLRRRRGEDPEQAELLVAPRSLYVLGGVARAVWQHMVKPVAQERWSLTFRTLKSGSSGAPGTARARRADLRRQGEG